MTDTDRQPIHPAAIIAAIAADRMNPVWRDRRRYTSRHDVEAALRAELLHAEKDSIRVSRWTFNDFARGPARTPYRRSYLPRENAAERAFTMLLAAGTMRGLVREYIRGRRRPLTAEQAGDLRNRFRIYRHDQHRFVRALALYQESIHG